jgi:molybdopterin synthase sulfur carrier subunit|tara:strand:- start:347 stop:598 length:252 start_codon:yes stop_codon:yes gene_type:complete
LKILYFAKIKEVIGKSEDSITINEQTTVKDIVEKLKIINESYKLAFQDLKNIKCSVNCNYIDSFQTKVTNNDEIAFFPPVTGG